MSILWPHRFPCEAPSFCCACGKIRLASPITQIALLELFKDPSSPLAILFRRQVRLYNNVFSFTSFGVRLDKKLAYLQRGVYTFRAPGQIFHSLPPLIPNSDGPSPSADQVAAIWVEGNDDANIPHNRDIVACDRDGQTHQIQHYYGYYDSLQYPFFFPYGYNGWQQNILKVKNGYAHVDVHESVLPLADVNSFDRIIAGESRVVRGQNDRMVSCREYYCYRLQIHGSNTSLILYGGLLLQQFVVDMSIKLETTRLDYYRKHQSERRSELY
ncbi:uncharacterized protein LOC142518929 isoform X2 [Primulina tabacum]|uniref:uncharacterized protein LOC142518929 isoform X2 n=1 Tax=Primulina tabacum TaxID=48773 RepID=UPI003F591729